MSAWRACVAALAVAVVVAACAGGGRGELVVLAAASLTDVLGDMAVVHEAAHPDVSVTLSFAGSSALREQVLAGAPADVVVLASQEVMADLVAAGAVLDPTVVATNTPTLVVPAGNPGGVTGLADLGADGLLVGLCRSAVPCGSLADEVLSSAGVEARVDTREPDVRALLRKLVDGELDAGIVYATDVVAAAGGVEVVALPGPVPVTSYPAAVTTDARSPDAAEDFVQLLTSDEGRALLVRRGFGAAP